MVLMVVRSGLGIAHASEVVTCETRRSVERKYSTELVVSTTDALKDMPSAIPGCGGGCRAPCLRLETPTVPH